MWTSVITIGKQLGGELDFIISELDGLKNLSHATDESVERVFIHLAALCEYSDEAVRAVTDILVEIYLCRIKADWFEKKLRRTAGKLAGATLLGALVGFDRAFEEAHVRRVLAEQAEYSVDGIFSFRLQRLTANWDEVCDLANHLLEVTTADEDVYGVAGFLAPSEKSRPLMLEKAGDNYRLIDERGRPVKRHYRTDDPDKNLVFDVARLHPSTLVAACPLSSDLERALAHSTTLA